MLFVRNFKHVVVLQVWTYPCIWIITAPKLCEEDKEAYIRLTDKSVHEFLPDEGAQPELYDSVKTYQLFKHVEKLHSKMWVNFWKIIFKENYYC